MINRLWTSRRLIWELTKKDLRARYVGSMGGVAWNIVQPLALIAIFTFLFTSLLKIREFGGGKAYLFYLIAGLLPWNAFQEGLQRASNIFVENARLIQKIPFPLESLVAQAVLTSALSLAVGMTVFVFFLPLLDVKFSASLLLMPVGLLLEILLMAGPALLLASLTPFWRDVPPFASLALFIGFWLTPIVYMPQVLPAETARWFSFNPFHHLASFFRATMSGQGWPGINAIAGLLLASLLMLLVGAYTFQRTHRKVAELL